MNHTRLGVFDRYHSKQRPQFRPSVFFGILLLSALFTNMLSAQSQSLSVLHIGNSYTDQSWAHFGLVVGGDPNRSLHQEAIVKNGSTLQEHYNNRLAAIQTKLQSRTWDMVILQEQSQTPVWNLTGFQQGAAALAGVIQQYAPTAKIYMFQTWARKAGNSMYQTGYVPFNPDEMQAILTANYASVANQIGASIIRVGDAWQQNYIKSNPIDLHKSDGSHPRNPTGRYITGMVHYITLFGADASDTSYTAGLSTLEINSMRASIASAGIHPFGDPEISISRQSGGDLGHSVGHDALVNSRTGILAQHTYAVNNHGSTGTLSVTAITATPTGVTNCTVTSNQASGFSVSPSGAGNFTVDVMPTSTGPYEFTVSISSNDADEATYQLVVIGEAVQTINSFPFTENFDAATADGWTTQGTTTSWEWGIPASSALTLAASGAKCWATNLTGNYGVTEQGAVYSPYFDLSTFTLSDPNISLSLWVQSEQDFDGAVLQSSIDNGASWQTVGSSASSNWFDSTNIGSQPGGQGEGWSGQVSSWLTLSHELTGLGGQSAVLFRISFSSDLAVSDEGVAFDDFKIFGGSGSGNGGGSSGNPSGASSEGGGCSISSQDSNFLALLILCLSLAAYLYWLKLTHSSSENNRKL